MDIISNEELKEQLHNQFEAFIKSRNKRQTQERYKIMYLSWTALNFALTKELGG